MLTFKPHCQAVKKLCESRLQSLQMIGANLPRGNRASLLQFGSILVTAKLTYGIGIVSRGGPEILQILAPAYNKRIRCASRVFVTSPIILVMAKRNTPPFEFLAVQSIARTAIRIQGKQKKKDISLSRLIIESYCLTNWHGRSTLENE